MAHAGYASTVGDRVTWAGHATALIELGGVRLLTDPVFSRHVAHLRRRAPLPGPEITTGLDAILISHLHPDHADRRSLRRLDPAVPVLCPPRGAGFLRGLGFADVRELAPGDREAVAGVEVVATEADHRGGRHPLSSNDADAVGYLIDRPRRVYFAGDTDLFEGMRELRPIDLALLPISGWGTGLGTGHLSPERAARAASMMEAQIAVPIHWGTYTRIALKRRRREALLCEPPRRFVEIAAKVATDVQVRVLRPGASLELGGEGAADGPRRGSGL